MHPVKLSLHYVDMVRTKQGKHNTAGLDSTVSHTGFYNIMSEESSTCSTFTTLRVTFGNLRSLQVKSAAVILIVNIFIFEMASVISLWFLAVSSPT